MVSDVMTLYHNHAMNAWSSGEHGGILIMLNNTTEIFHRR